MADCLLAVLSIRHIEFYGDGVIYCVLFNIADFYRDLALVILDGPLLPELMRLHFRSRLCACVSK